MHNAETWAVVLAAGAGTRLSSLTRIANGNSTPKQYCSLVGGSTLLEDTIARAERFASPARTVAIVADEHAAWWQPQLASLSYENIIVQPKNRGTAIGILLTALHIARRAPDSALVFLPSDHFIRNEAIISDCVRRGVDYLSMAPDRLLLIGITPDEVDPELGYIVPGKADAQDVFAVSQFVEKPDRVAAQALLAAGSVWNSFIFAVRARALIDMFTRTLPGTLAAMQAALTRDDWFTFGGTALSKLYQSLTEVDFSRRVLEGNEAMLRVLPAPRCGWTDLGTPQRVGKCVEQIGTRSSRRKSSVISHPPFINLAAAYARLRMAS